MLIDKTSAASFSKARAYKIVFDDLIQHNLFKGIYDAKNGNEYFMYGIGIVMEYIAHGVSEEYLKKFNETFTQNMITSEDAARQSEIQDKN